MSTGWGLTFLGGGHWQERFDADEDDWSDLPEYTRGIGRPRVFWNDDKGNRFFATAGVTVENREGGSPSSHVEAIDTRAYDAGVLDQRILGGQYVLITRAAWSLKNHDHQFGDVLERDRHTTAFGEVTVRGTAGPHTWVAGAAVEADRYTATDVPQFSYAFTTPGVFVQDDVAVKPWLSLSGSARLDHHSEYGMFVSPRVSALLRSGSWNSRASFGTGFFGPSALTEETEAAGLTRLSMPLPLLAEEGTSGSFDITRSSGPLSATLTLFGSRVRNSITVDRDTVFAIRNAERTSNTGVEMLMTLRQEPFALTGTYTYVRSRERDGGDETAVALTPAHSAGVVGMWEKEDVGRIGVELYYTGTQRLEVNPYADESEPVRDSRPPRRTAVRPAARVHQRRKPYRRQAIEVEPAGEAVTWRGRPLDRGRVGAARRAQHQRWREVSVLVMERHR